MPCPPHTEDPLDIAARALARRDRGMPSLTPECIAWQQASPAHAAAMEEIESVWRRLDVLRTLCPDGRTVPNADLLVPLPPSASAPETAV